MLIENLLSDICLLESDYAVKTANEVSSEELIRGIQKFIPKIQEYYVLFLKIGDFLSKKIYW